MLRTQIIASLSFLVGCILVVGCTSTTPTTDNDVPAGETIVAAVNANCPIMGNPVKDDGGRTEWNGQTIGFCCPKCIEDWDALSEEEKASHLTAGDADHSGHEGHDGHEGH